MIEQNKSLEGEAFSQFESKQVELEELTTMFWYIYEDYFAYTNQDIYTKANYYDRLQPFLYNIHTLLYDKNKEMQEYIDKVYEERKAGKKQ